MDVTVLDDIPFRLDSGSFLKSLNLKEDPRYLAEIESLLEEAHRTARPKGLYGIAFVEARDEGSVVVEGIRFRSRVLRVNVGETQRLFPFLATCGVELDEWSRSADGMLARYWADQIKEMALEQALNAVTNHLVETYQPGPIATMNPGSLPDWPVSEQKELFALLGNAAASIGVHLTGSLMMVPVKSVSGVSFPSDTGFENCQLCPLRQCPKRRAPYDAGLYEGKFRNP